jgi:hypothetical protein
MLLNVVLFSTLLNFCLAQKVEISINFNSDTQKYDVINKISDSADAFGFYHKNYNSSGWNFLDNNMQTEISSVEDHLLYSKSFGFLEGYVTCQDIRTFYPNFYSAVFGKKSPGPETIKFIESNFIWLKEMSEKYAGSDEYWYAVKTILQQIQGLYEGYSTGCPSSAVTGKTVDYSTLESPTLMHFVLMNAWGDLYQITMKHGEPGMGARLQGNRNYKNEKKTLVERCSAIVKLLPGNADVVYGHSTWDSYESLSPRILKHYSFPLMRRGKAEHHYDVHFSSSPALLTSVDDFFTVSGYAQLGVIETTNNLYNLQLLDKVVPQSVLSWTRAITSNQIATSGAHWAETFSRYQSGTYTNQWMVLDLKLFAPGSPPQKGFFTVLEEVPGLVHVEDQTATLIAEGYWGSYNIPVYADISEAAGYAALCAKSTSECHDTCPRALIFKQYQSQITDVAGGEWMLSYNGFKNDSASQNDSCNAIACRGDLEPREVSRGAYGALDAKVTSATLSKRNPGNSPVYFARLGPTHQELPVFCWSQLADEDEYRHEGQPDCFDFDFQAFPPPVV